ncbi:methylmalonate-semialdehyde dehydrogenase [Anopheles sinensis]|uniref:Methylmalonate-semialdehyde dehydrogenase n=1 Tax=Anopheles sinensis TaxID=74873 RepID=A0A084VY30_ANOSI|nr:methylmalonate-semialdehyde dehydrogenase [Anopheles sinensis]
MASTARRVVLLPGGTGIGFGGRITILQAHRRHYHLPIRFTWFFHLASLVSGVVRSFPGTSGVRFVRLSPTQKEATEIGDRTPKRTFYFHSNGRSCSCFGESRNSTVIATGWRTRRLPSRSRCWFPQAATMTMAMATTSLFGQIERSTPSHRQQFDRSGVLLAFLTTFNRPP